MGGVAEQPQVPLCRRGQGDRHHDALARGRPGRAAPAAGDPRGAAAPAGGGRGGRSPGPRPGRAPLPGAGEGRGLAAGFQKGLPGRPQGRRQSLGRPLPVRPPGGGRQPDPAALVAALRCPGSACLRHPGDLGGRRLQGRGPERFRGYHGLGQGGDKLLPAGLPQSPPGLPRDAPGHPSHGAALPRGPGRADRGQGQRPRRHPNAPAGAILHPGQPPRRQDRPGQCRCPSH